MSATPPPFTHPCKDTCSGYKQAAEEAVKVERERIFAEIQKAPSVEVSGIQYIRMGAILLAIDPTLEPILKKVLPK